MSGNKTVITKIECDWKEVKNDCRITVNKEASDKEATVKFKREILMAEHSPINQLRIKWLWGNMKSWISVHFARHWLGWNKWISTRRTDRTGEDRNKLPQDVPVNYSGEANAMALINVSRKRLCGQASPETRHYMEDLKKEIHNAGEVEIAEHMVPNCIYRGGCPEIFPCPYYGRFLKYCKENNLPLNTLRQRYDAYNQMFKEDNYSQQFLK